MIIQEQTNQNFQKLVVYILVLSHKLGIKPKLNQVSGVGKIQSGVKVARTTKRQKQIKRK